MQNLLKLAVVPNTAKNYKCSWRMWVAFNQATNLSLGNTAGVPMCDPLKPTKESLLRWIGHMADEIPRPKYATVHKKLAAVSAMILQLTGELPAELSSPIIKVARRAYCRLVGAAKGQRVRYPITSSVLAMLRPQFDITNIYRDLVVWAALTIAVFCSLRVADFAAEERSDDNEYQPARSPYITYGDITPLPRAKGDGYSIILPRTKTELEAKGTPVCIFRQHNDICPVKALESLWLYAGVDKWKKGDPLFPMDDSRPMIATYFTKHLRTKLETSVPNISQFYGFDTRAGGAQSVHNADGSEADRQAQGRWKGNSYKRYSVHTAAIQQRNQSRISSAASAPAPQPHDYIIFTK